MKHRLALGIIIGWLLTAGIAAPSEDSAVAAQTDPAFEIFQLVNNFRASLGLPSFQYNSILANAYAFNELYGLGVDEVEEYPHKVMAVTRKDVLEAAQSHIDLTAPVLAIIRPA